MTTKRLVVTSLLLFLTVVVVYLSNGRSIGAGDTLPTRYLPFSLLREHDFDLDEYPALYGEEALRMFPVQAGIPYFMIYRDGRYFSAYPPGPGVLAVPVYALPVLLGASADTWAPALEKLAATLITAMSVVVLFLALGEMVSGGWALTIATIYAFGTSSWSVSSQALWQHGPSQLFLAVLVLCLARALRDPRYLAYAGFAAAAATAMRATDALIALPIGAWVLYTNPKLALRFGLWALPPLIGLALYNLPHFGSPTGHGGAMTSPAWALFSQVPVGRGLAGVLLSPSRGLFVYSPVLLFSVVGLLLVGRRGPLLFKPLAGGVVLVTLLVSRWFVWWGGHSWGPRLLADLTPLLCFFLYPVTGLLDRYRSLKAGFLLLAALSIGAHGLGAFFYDFRWDARADVGRSDAPLWSWREGPLAFYGRHALAAARRALPLPASGVPTSADTPIGLAASYTVTPLASEAYVGEPIDVTVAAVNLGRAVWLASAPNSFGEVRLGWRWRRGDVDLEGGRAFLFEDTSPGQVARFAARIAPPAAVGDYVLTIDLVSERVTWFADRGHPPIRAAVRVLPLGLDRLLSDTAVPAGRAVTAAISTGRGSYRRGETLDLRVESRNPNYPPDKFDVYLLRQGPDGAASFYNGHRPPASGDSRWVALVRDLPMPALVVSRFALPLSDVAAGAHRWHVVVVAAGTYRPLARASAEFRVEP